MNLPEVGIEGARVERYGITYVFIISVILSPFSKIRPARNTETTISDHVCQAEIRVIQQKFAL
jgi:hypothetical protein